MIHYKTLFTEYVIYIYYYVIYNNILVHLVSAFYKNILSHQKGSCKGFVQTVKNHQPHMLKTPSACRSHDRSSQSRAGRRFSEEELSRPSCKQINKFLFLAHVCFFFFIQTFGSILFLFVVMQKRNTDEEFKLLM